MHISACTYEAWACPLFVTPSNLHSAPILPQSSPCHICSTAVPIPPPTPTTVVATYPILSHARPAHIRCPVQPQPLPAPGGEPHMLQCLVPPSVQKTVSQSAFSSVFCNEAPFSRPSAPLPHRSVTLQPWCRCSGKYMCIWIYLVASTCCRIQRSWMMVIHFI